METADRDTAAGSIVRDRYVLAEPYESEGTASAWWAVDAVLHRTIVIAFDDPAPAPVDDAVAATATLGTAGPEGADDPAAPVTEDDGPDADGRTDQAVSADEGATLAAASIPTAGARAQAGLGDVLDGGWHDGSFYRVYRLPFEVEGGAAIPPGVVAAVRAADDGPRSAWAVAAAITGGAPAPAAVEPAGPAPAAGSADDITAVLDRPQNPQVAPWSADLEWMTAARAHHAPPQPEDPTVEVPLPVPAGRAPGAVAAAGPLGGAVPVDRSAPADPTAILPTPAPAPVKAPRPVRTTGPRPPISRPRRPPAPDAATAAAAADRAASRRRPVQTLVPMAVVVAVVLVGGVVLQWWPSREPQVGTPAVAAGQPTPPPTTAPVPVETEPPAPVETTTTVITRPRPATTTTVEETTTTEAPVTTAPATPSTRAAPTTAPATTRTTREANSGPGGGPRPDPRPEPDDDADEEDADGGDETASP